MATVDLVLVLVWVPVLEDTATEDLALGWVHVQECLVLEWAHHVQVCLTLVCLTLVWAHAQVCLTLVWAEDPERHVVVDMVCNDGEGTMIRVVKTTNGPKTYTTFLSRRSIYIYMICVVMCVYFLPLASEFHFKAA